MDILNFVVMNWDTIALGVTTVLAFFTDSKKVLPKKGV